MNISFNCVLKNDFIFKRLVVYDALSTSNKSEPLLNFLTDLGTTELDITFSITKGES